MTLTEKQIAYENDCRQIFVGQTIRAVIYGELQYFMDENGNDISPKPFYKTKYSEIDTLDHSIYFKTDEKTIYVFWDNTFVCYGLQSQLLELTAETNNYEQKWEVSAEKKWSDLIGEQITDFKILWEEIWYSNLDGSNKVYYACPQTFEITTNSGKKIIISASEFEGGEDDEIYSQMDNLLVTTNIDLAKKLKLIE
jgi:hypothetical protein